MTSKQKTMYFFATLGMLILLAIIEFFILLLIDNHFYMNWSIHLVIFVGLLILVNPFIVMYAVNKIPFKIAGLKLEAGLQEELKKKNIE